MAHTTLCNYCYLPLCQKRYSPLTKVSYVVEHELVFVPLPARPDEKSSRLGSRLKKEREKKDRVNIYALFIDLGARGDVCTIVLVSRVDRSARSSISVFVIFLLRLLVTSHARSKRSKDSGGATVRWSHSIASARVLTSARWDASGDGDRVARVVRINDS